MNISTIGYVEYEMPFCGPFICDSSGPTLENYNNLSEVVLWKCMPAKCKQTQIGIIAVLIIISVIIIGGNMAVLVVNLAPNTRRTLCRNPTMHNYSNYVISLSLADLLVGILVLPMSVIFFYDEMLAPRIADTLQAPTISPSSSNVTITTSKAYLEQTAFLTMNDVNITNVRKPGSRMNESFFFTSVLGFVTHLSIFVSMYTLIAASIDRFYVSTKATTHVSKRFSSLSLGQFNRGRTLLCCAGSERHSNFCFTRSAIILFFVWFFGVLISITPCNHLLNNHYRQVGHIFVLFSFNENYVVALAWYLIILFVPFFLTWIFSILLCFVLWKRKKKLKKSSSLHQNHSISDKKTDEKDCDSSYELTSRYSNIETPKLERMISFATDQSMTQDDNREDYSSDTCEVVNENKPNLIKVKALRGNRSVGNLSLLLYKKKLSGSLDFTSSEIKPSSSGIGSSARMAARQKSEINGRNSAFDSRGRSRSSEVLSQSSLLRNSFFRANGKTVSFNDDGSALIATAAPSPLTKEIKGTKNESTTQLGPTPALRPGFRSKSEGTRYTQRSTRRRSSIFRAKELITSNTFESNVVKSLLAMICALTVSVLPITFVLFDLAPQYSTSVAPSNATVTKAVVTVIVLFLNSFWNCVIYGGRTRYFRSSLKKNINKAIRCKNSTVCHIRCSRGSFKAKTSFFKSDTE